MNPQSLTALAARMLISSNVLFGAYEKITGFQAARALMASKGMHHIHLVLILAILVELAAGLSILLGLRARWGAVALILYMIPTTLTFHSFWAAGAPSGDLTQFFKSLARMGGLLMVAAFGPGALSLDQERGKGIS